MSELIDKIKETINMDDLGEICQDYADSIQYTDENIIVLKISIEDLENESFDKIVELGRVEYSCWEALKSLVPEGEVDSIKKEFAEDLQEFMEDEDNGVESAEQIYKSVLYCNNEYVWSGTTF
jgi:hypothetical protein